MRSQDHWVAHVQLGRPTAGLGTLISAVAIYAGSGPQGLWPALIGWLVFGVRAWLLHSERIEVRGLDVFELKGVLRPSEKRTAISALESVALQQTVMGQLLGYHTLLLKPIGQVATSHRHVANARAVADAIESARRPAGNNPVPAELSAVPGLSAHTAAPAMPWSDIQAILTLSGQLGHGIAPGVAALKQTYLPIARDQRLGLVLTNVENGLSTGSAHSDFDLSPRERPGSTRPYVPFDFGEDGLRTHLLFNMAEIVAGPIQREDRMGAVARLLRDHDAAAARAGFHAVLDRAGPASLGLVLFSPIFPKTRYLLPIPADGLAEGFATVASGLGPLPLDNLYLLCRDRAALAQFKEAMGSDGNIMLGLLGLIRLANLEPRFAAAISTDHSWQGDFMA
jgi:hypothetical protein